LDHLTHTYGPLDEVLPLAPLQEGLLFHARFDTTATDDVYTVQVVLALEGVIDVARLHAAVAALQRRQTALRAAFWADGREVPVQVIARTVPMAWAEVDLASADAATALPAWLAADRRRRFDLAQPPLLRWTLLHVGAGQHRLVLTTHHVLVDGWSMPVLVHELLALYEAGGDASRLPPVPPYRDYMAWVCAQDRAAARSAWNEALAGLDEGTVIVRETAAAPALPQVLHEPADAALSAAVHQRARSLGVTMNTLLQAAWAVVLAQLTGRRDVVFGTTVSGRPSELAGIETLIGLLINTVPVRVRLDPAESWRSLVQRVQREQAALLPHQHLPLRHIQQTAVRGPLFDTLVVFDNYPAPPEAGAGGGGDLHLRGAAGLDAAHYPLAVVALPGPQLTFRCDYRPDVLSAEQVRPLLTRLLRVLDAIVTDPAQCVGSLQLLTVAERGEVLEAGQGPWRDELMPSTIPALVDAHVRARPEAIAVMQDDLHLSYAGLAERAHQLAHVLVAQGVGPESVVGVALPRSADLVVTLLAILEAGGAYLPVDENAPVFRQAALLATANAACVVTRGTRTWGQAVRTVALDAPDVETALAAAPRQAPQQMVSPAQAAYVLFTSGSTGTPKGVVVTHQNVGRLVAAPTYVALSAADAVLQVAPMAFDASTFEVWAPLAAGARVVVGPAAVTPSVGQIEVSLRRGEVTVALLTAGLFELMARERVMALRGLRALLTGGDVVPPEAVERVQKAVPACQVIDAYGPTEVTTISCAYPVPAGWKHVAVPIGRPIEETRGYVLDGTLALVPVGVVGELYVAGAGLARG
ncbi:MAG TPA: condensation domain-containing protein, partial [Lysobacter sp.]